MSEYKDFSSLPPDKERHFVVFERHAVETGKKARTIGMIVAGVFGLLMVAITFASEPPEPIMADEDMGLLSKKDGEEAEKKAEPAEEQPAAPSEAAEPADEAAEADKAAAGESE